MRNEETFVLSVEFWGTFENYYSKKFEEGFLEGEAGNNGFKVTPNKWLRGNRSTN
jgi:hypothetical protein